MGYVILYPGKRPFTRLGHNNIGGGTATLQNMTQLEPAHINNIYSDIISQHWGKIVKLYELSPGRSIMVYELPSHRIYAYSYKEYKNNLNARSQAMLKKQYREARHTNGMVLFIRDYDRKLFKSYVLPLE